MKKYLLLTQLFVFQSAILFACSCAPIATFCETITYGNNGIIHESNTIVQVEVIKEKVDGIDVKIESVLFGTSTVQELFILKGGGSFCTVNTDLFSEGEFYIFNLYQPDTNQDLYIGDCGINYLKIENGIVQGPIAPNLESIAFDEFNSVECFANVSVAISNVSMIAESLTVFPNPTDGNFHILNSIEIKENQNVEIELIDLQGRIIYKSQKTEGWSSNEEWNININEMVEGIYFLKVFIEEKSVIIKVVKI